MKSRNNIGAQYQENTSALLLIQESFEIFHLILWPSEWKPPLQKLFWRRATLGHTNHVAFKIIPWIINNNRSWHPPVDPPHPHPPKVSWWAISQLGEFSWVDGISGDNFFIDIHFKRILVLHITHKHNIIMHIFIITHMTSIYINITHTRVILFVRSMFLVNHLLTHFHHSPLDDPSYVCIL